MFSRLTSLQQLDLSGNSLVRLEADCLVGLGSLQTLDMSGNTISALPRGVFKSLGSLTSLDLSKNDIIYINATGKVDVHYLPLTQQKVFISTSAVIFTIFACGGSRF